MGSLCRSGALPGEALSPGSCADCFSGRRGWLDQRSMKPFPSSPWQEQNLVSCHFTFLPQTPWDPQDWGQSSEGLIIHPIVFNACYMWRGLKTYIPLSTFPYES